MIPAHDSPLAAITFNTSGTKLASASQKVGPGLTVCLSVGLSVCLSVCSVCLSVLLEVVWDASEGSIG